MDDLNKDIFQVWQLRLKLERLKKRLKVVIATLELGEYRQKHGEEAYQEVLAEVDDLKKEQLKMELNQQEMEAEIHLPNPYLKKDN